MDGLTKDIDFGIYDFGPKRTLSDYERYSGLSFKHRRAHKYTLEHNLPPNPEMSDADFEDDASYEVASTFNHCIDLQKGMFVETDYDFWAIIYEDELGALLYRRDHSETDIRGYLNASNSTSVIQLRSEFSTTKKPFKLIVWPHSKSKGWLKKIENRL